MRRRTRLIETALKSRPRRVPVPTFLVDLEPWHRTFFGNLREALWPRKRPSLELVSSPADFWPDVFVQYRLPWGDFAKSAIFHTAVIALLWGSDRLWLQPTRIVAPVAFHSSDVVYYQASDYLPPLDTGGAKRQVSAKGDPAHAPQAIISVPPDADNRRQTIVTPPNLKLEHDVQLPNVVAWNRVQPAIPLAAATRRTSDVKLPALSTSVIAPPPEMERQLRKAPMPAESPIAPAPDVDSRFSRHTALTPQQAVVAPPPGIELASTRKLTDINIGHAEVVAPAPQLPMEEQHAAQRAMSGRAQASLGNAGAAVVPPPPSVQGAGTTSQQGRLIALNLEPVSPAAPVEVPEGNRKGTFAATPEGKAGASGTPDNTGAKDHNSNAAGPGHSPNTIPPGLFVAATRAGGPVSVIAGMGRSGGAAGNGSTAADPSLMASAASPQPGSLPRKVASIMSPDQQTDVERKVFAGRQSYAMTLNLPNLNSAEGSWVMHFSELQDEKQPGNLSAPVATKTVDPGYPLELMRENVRGSVTLAAVIRSDGSVSEVQILNGIDDRLDEYARNALKHWRFLPALRNGNPVALQAVVIIPFRPRQKVGF
jgi:TonB family protein